MFIAHNNDYVYENAVFRYPGLEFVSIGEIWVEPGQWDDHYESVISELDPDAGF